MQPELKLPCTVYRLRMAARRATRLYDRHLAAAGLGIAQFGLLQIISMRGGASVTEVAGALDMDRTTLTRNLTPLAREGLVDLAPGRDKRSRALTITAAGKARLALALPLWREAQRMVRKSLGESEVEQLHALLDSAMLRLPEV